MRRIFHPAANVSRPAPATHVPEDTRSHDLTGWDGIQWRDTTPRAGFRRMNITGQMEAPLPLAHNHTAVT